MKINEKFICLPPYLSVSWKEVTSLRMEGQDLCVQLRSEDLVYIPHLPQDILDALFNYHQRYLEQEGVKHHVSSNQKKDAANFFDQVDIGNISSTDLPFAFKIGTPDGIISATGHNPVFSKAPSLPPGLLDKFTEILPLVGVAEIEQMPGGVEGCNCFFCQIMNRLQSECQLVKEDEAITEADLKFREWVIEQTGDKLYSVENSLNSTEKYSVYLGHPVGCSCGAESCEHIIAVLKS